MEEAGVELWPMVEFESWKPMRIPEGPEFEDDDSNADGTGSHNDRDADATSSHDDSSADSTDSDDDSDADSTDSDEY
ncbi:hypothetical protein E4U60_007888 [Claviceps pazoutovae]|uniref:Uncharacterized protein n=1 Tax=Claviceps pazoutovae TaxID=1649127 RepID=A0A9P7MEQ0_9HYPO|nr:hypothetical protein E4U60_007888 [Claviceps pazoutovae]